ncbi:penicillin-binding transpeptidase domain-containing protein [Massilia sp. H6]|uniref:penicillin-binding transpeptidase domain-containing protein n=1 Tax=Massilia sp. H6 TaxID=2970464 RepID=UPI0021674F5F|nr:penicillin-binding transpeptidase domain-containing protein [Massilia sp. H6]UVW26897.1 penicillin-binding transpeptidase domain-containing protein [Massilia sp. H6]
MTNPLAQLAATMSATLIRWRRARNLRAASRVASRVALRVAKRAAAPRRFWLAPWVMLAGVAALLCAGVLAQAARALSGTASGTASATGSGMASATALHDPAAGASALAGLQPLLGGARIHVPHQAGIAIEQHGAVALVVASSMQAQAPLRIDLCSQLSGSGRSMLPLRIGYPFSETRVAGSAARNALLAAPGSAMPRIELRGDARAALRLSWDAGAAQAAWISDAGTGAVMRAARGQARLGQAGWLVWNDGALRLTRRALQACPQAGELVVQAYQPRRGGSGAGLVQAFGGGAVSPALALAPGNYQVPAAPARALEDAQLFERLHQRGLIRLASGGSGLVELAPRDLAAWAATAPGQRLPLPGWDSLRLDATDRKLLERLYYRADGAFVREQVRVFNSERRLLAWRLRPEDRSTWQASVGGMPVAQLDALPVAAMRLFARLPQGWAGWRRVAAWDHGDAAQGSVTVAPRSASLSLDAGRPAELLLVGRVRKVSGATASIRGECDGRACASRDAVQHVLLAPLPGARRIVLEVEPLDLDALSGGANAAYRHLHNDGGRLAWRALAVAQVPLRAAQADVQLSDRNGVALWVDGQPSAAASNAGLGTLLGVHRDHAASVAGMLARVPGAAHTARLSLDLAMQVQAQAALDCIGLRQGSLVGAQCSGARAVPAGRQAGLVVLDAGNGELLAVAGGGVGDVRAFKWPEVRDFDRADPARSLLRLPALQHDGGAQRAPGSTFKVVSALGLEGAARTDRRLERLLQGMPLADIDRLPGAHDYGFRTAAAAYPGPSGARITNFREQPAAARAQEGRFGLEQALAHSVNTWFAWTAELSDRSLGARAQGGAPGVRALEPGALDALRPIAGMARKLGFGTSLRLDGGLLPADFHWSAWDALQASAAALDPIQTRHEVRQMAIGLRMQATPLQMALVAGAVGQGRVVTPHLLMELDGRAAATQAGPELGVRLDRIRAGMKDVIDSGTAAGAFRGSELARLRAGLFGKTGTAPTGDDGMATVWFTGWLEPGSLPGQTRRLAFAAFVSQSGSSGGAHAAPMVAAMLRSMQARPAEQKAD